MTNDEKKEKLRLYNREYEKKHIEKRREQKRKWWNNNRGKLVVLTEGDYDTL